MSSTKPYRTTCRAASASLYENNGLIIAFDGQTMRLLLLISAFAITMTAHAQRNKDVVEDLASIRPRFPAQPTTTVQTQQQQVTTVVPVLTVNSKVDAVLDSIDRLNSLRKFVPGFTIQIYSGQNKEDANNAKKKLSDVADMKADLQYVQPKFRVKVGAYFTALEAQKDITFLKRFFPNAILVPETIQIK